MGGENAAEIKTNESAPSLAASSATVMAI